MKQFTVFLGISFLSCFLLFGCKKEQPILSDGLKDCGCAKEVSAEFLIEEESTTFEPRLRYTITDSIFGNKNVRFTAMVKDAKYTWYIGSEKLTDKTFRRYFSNALVGQSIPISLVVRKNPNNICFPNDDGYDSLTKRLIVARRIYSEDFDSLRFCGTYRVKSPLLKDSITINVENVKSGTNRTINFYNFDGIGTNCINTFHQDKYGCNYRQLFVHDPAAITNGKYLKGSVLVQSDNSAELDLISGEYVNGKFVEEYYFWKYRGRKIL